MEKIELPVSSKKLTEIEHKDTTISVDPYISLSNEKQLIRDYTTSYFQSDDIVASYIEAEYSLVLQILSYQTSLKIVDDEKVILDIDNFMATELWNKIKDSIKNYAIFIEHLSVIIKRIEDQKALEKSIGANIDKIATKAFEFLDKVSQLDLSEDGVKKMVGELSDISNKYFKDYGDLPPVNKPRARRKKAEEGK
jgi:DNA repair ATPase RecN